MHKYFLFLFWKFIIAWNNSTILLTNLIENIISRTLTGIYLYTSLGESVSRTSQKRLLMHTEIYNFNKQRESWLIISIWVYNCTLIEFINSSCSVARNIVVWEVRLLIKLLHLISLVNNTYLTTLTYLRSATPRQSWHKGFWVRLGQSSWS